MEAGGGSEEASSADEFSERDNSFLNELWDSEGGEGDSDDMEDMGLDTDISDVSSDEDVSQGGAPNNTYFSASEESD